MDPYSTQVLQLLEEHARIKPYKHQNVGVQKLVDHEFFFNTDEMGAGKTKQVIDAAQVLYYLDVIDHVLVVAPASVRDVWFDPELGEIIKHSWDGVNMEVMLWHSRSRSWGLKYAQFIGHEAPLEWTITNYDYIRQPQRYKQLAKMCNKRTLLVLDESSAVKNYKSQQSQACNFIRQRCGRVILLNGTPIANSPADLYMQARILSPDILECDTWFHFRSRYAVMGGWENRQIVSWTNLEDIQKRMAPYVIRRLKSDCMDLPKKLPSVVIPVYLTPETWAKYKEQRDQMVTWLDAQTVSISQQAITKVMRLAQITSGFISGVEKVPQQKAPPRPAWLPPLEVEEEDLGDDPEELEEISEGAFAIGREKLDALLEWLDTRLQEDPGFKFVCFCRFRAELARYEATCRTRYQDMQFDKIWGGQKKGERLAALKLLHPDHAGPGPAGIFATPGSGSMGLNMSRATAVIYPSNDYKLWLRSQSEDRAHRPGQTRPVSYFDIVACGPKGQKTIDHIILKALRKKDNLAQWTIRAWQDAFRDVA